MPYHVVQGFRRLPADARLVVIAALSLCADIAAVTWANDCFAGECIPGSRGLRGWSGIILVLATFALLVREAAPIIGNRTRAWLAREATSLLGRETVAEIPGVLARPDLRFAVPALVMTDVLWNRFVAGSTPAIGAWIGLLCGALILAAEARSRARTHSLSAFLQGGSGER